MVLRRAGVLAGFSSSLLAFALAALGGCAETAEAAQPTAIHEGGVIADDAPPPDRRVIADDALPDRAAMVAETGSGEDGSPGRDGDMEIDAGRAVDADGGIAIDAGRAVDADGDAPAALRCNGYEALCDRPFDQVVFATTHNSMSNADDGWLIPNQMHPIFRQLEDGVRAFLIDTYSYLGAGYLCHQSCLLGNKPLIPALTEIARFLQDHRNEVLALDIEDHLGATETDDAFRTSGLAAFVYTHAAGEAWPTLRNMIASGHRVFVGAEMGGPPPAWYHHFYDLAWDTPYTFRNATEFSCAENRGSRNNALFLLNHWIENPIASEDLSRTANARDVLLGRARQCQMESGRLPNFIAVNHYSVGDLFAVVRELNGL
jgi:hypothetical protein